MQKGEKLGNWSEIKQNEGDARINYLKKTNPSINDFKINKIGSVQSRNKQISSGSIHL